MKSKMLGRIIKRSASSKAFSVPPVKFRYTTRDHPSVAEEESRAEGKEKHTPRITSPVRPIQRDTRKNPSRKNVFQEKIPNQITKKHDRNKSDFGLENYKVHAASSSIKFDPKRGERGHHDTYQPMGELIYGIYPVQLALEAQRRTFHHLMYKKGCELRNERIRNMVDTAASRGIRTTGLTPSQFRKVLTGDQTHQGICCDVSHLPFLAFQEHEYLTVKENDEVGEERKGTEGEVREGRGMWDRRELRESKEVRENRGLKGSRERREDGRSEGNQYNSSEGSFDEEGSLHIDQDSLSGKAKDKHRHKNMNSVSSSSLHRKPSYYHEELRTDIRSVPSNHEDSVHESSETKIPQLWIYLDQIQDPMNFGAVVRSAYFFGVDKILTSERNSCLLSGIVSKASSGVLEVVPVYVLPQPSAVILSQLSQTGWVLAASAHPDAGRNVTPVDNFTPHGNTILIVGSESKGVHEEVLNVCDVVLTVPPARPVHQAASCLNVSAATAVLLHTLSSKLRNTTSSALFTANSTIPSLAGS